MLFHTCVSLGEQCKTAYQLRRHTGVNTAHILDWLVTPAESLLHLIRDDFGDFFALENLAVMPDGNGVLDQATGVIFQHGFQRDADGKTVPSGIAEGHARELGRLRHLLARWRALADAERILFVRSGEYTAGFPAELLDALCTRFPETDITLLMVSEHQSPQTSGDGRVIERRVADDYGVYPDLWMGRDDGWDSVLD
jgi:hypothetical protein